MYETKKKHHIVPYCHSNQISQKQKLFLQHSPDLRVTLEELRALAVNDVVADFAVSVLAAGPVGARVDAAQILALLVAGAVAVAVALGAAAVQRVADVVAEARAHGALSVEGTLGVAAAGRRVAVVACEIWYR